MAGDAIDLKTVGVKASSWEQKAHGGVADFPPGLTIDGDLSPTSSWRAEGDGQWIEYDLGKSPTLSGIKIAFFKGDARQYRFDIQVSKSGAANEWQTVLKAQRSSGKSAGLESHSFAPVAARYLRIIGYGNTNEQFAKWTNILEVSFLLAPSKPE